MTKEEAIKFLQQLYPNGGHCWLDEQRIEAISMAINALQEEPACVKNKLNALSDGKQHLWWIDDAMVLEMGEELAKEVEDYIDVNGFDGLDSIEVVKSIACHFVNWQKEQFEKNRLAHCDAQTEEEAKIEQDFVMSIIEKEHRQPTFDDAIKYGMRLKEKEMQSTIELAEDRAMFAGMEKMKEELIAKAKGGTVQEDYQIIMDDGTYIDLDPSMSLNPSLAVREGERIKVIVIKED